MNAPEFPRSVSSLLALGLAAWLLGPVAAPTRGQDTFPPRPLRPAVDEFAAMSRSVIELLQQRDPARFANEVTAAAEDWKAIASTQGKVVKAGHPAAMNVDGQVEALLGGAAN